eukprot:CAMPEP_0169452834 /NCGR_PEP_ID=MMETSP1042-20121227/14444_1 /TAXON_ID=464988 /ORGANISM="Hemiselmis andersenii, Strain CCMP1180" /LENGTH=226 /DNA_ID=CAMNT_0009564843 /DNA_START=46 /DNA_END=723 /DNA_ORIENTATION=-
MRWVAIISPMILFFAILQLLQHLDRPVIRQVLINGLAVIPSLVWGVWDGHQHSKTSALTQFAQAVFMCLTIMLLILHHHREITIPLSMLVFVHGAAAALCASFLSSLAKAFKRKPVAEPLRFKGPAVSVRQEMALAVAMGTHARLGEGSALAGMQPDLMLQVARLAYSSIDAWEFRSCRMSSVFRHVRFGIQVELSNYNTDVVQLRCGGTGEHYALYRDGCVKPCG